MTAEQKSTLRQIVRDPAYEAALQEILEELPAASAQEILDGKFTTRQLADRHCFMTGVIYAFSEVNRRGSAPKSKRVHAQAKHLKDES